MNKKQLVAFEDYIKTLWEEGKLKCPIHFCGGNEDQLIDYFNRFVKYDDWVFSTWRNHYHYLLKTGDVEFLRKKIMNENNSMHIIDLPRKFISTAIVGGNAAPAVGTAYAIKLKKEKTHVHCFIGDGGCDSGWFFEAFRYAEGWNLPITFIIEDNNRSVATDIKTRWGKSKNLKELSTFNKVFYYKYKPIYPHVGTGKWVNW